MTDWISVKDRLPETRSQVHGPEQKRSCLLLIYSEEHGMVVGFMDEVDKENHDWIGWGVNDNLLITGVTHWMPLPEPPIEAL